jgi:hypothetical protein
MRHPGKHGMAAPSVLIAALGRDPFRTALLDEGTMRPAEIRSKLHQCRQQAEENKVDMRTYIGARYRDVIESADSIDSMKQCCHSILESVSSMNAQCRELRLSLQSVDGGAIRHGRSKAADTVSSGAQIKFLLETQSHIWSSLDNRLVLDGTIRYFAANSMLSDFQTREHKLFRRFAWLGAQGDIMRDLRKGIGDTCRRLLQSPAHTCQDYASILATVIMLENRDVPESLDLFLDSAQRWVECTAVVLLSCGDATTISDLAACIVDLANCLAMSICTVHFMFVAPPAPDNTMQSQQQRTGCLLQQLLSAARAATVAAPSDDPNDNFTVVFDTLHSRLRAWLLDCQTLIPEGVTWLTPANTIADLFQLSGAVARQMDSVLQERTFDLTWQQVWNGVVGSDTGGVWDSIFQRQFLNRAQEIVSVELDFGVFQSSQVEPWLASFNDSTEYSDDFSIGGYMWQQQRTVIRNTSGMDGPAIAVAVVFDDTRQSRQACGIVRGFDKKVIQMCRIFDRQIEQVLGDVKTNGEDLHGLATTNSENSMPELWTVLKRTCFASVSAWVDDMEGIVSKLSDDATVACDVFLNATTDRVPQSRVAVGLAQLLCAVSAGQLFAIMLASQDDPVEAAARTPLWSQLQQRVRMLSYTAMNAWVVAAMEVASMHGPARADAVYSTQRRGWQRECE